MWYVIASVLGMLLGGLGMYFALEARRHQALDARARTEKDILKLRQAKINIRQYESKKQEEFAALHAALNEEKEKLALQSAELQARIDDMQAELERERVVKLQQLESEIKGRRSRLEAEWEKERANLLQDATEGKHRLYEQRIKFEGEIREKRSRLEIEWEKERANFLQDVTEEKHRLNEQRMRLEQEFDARLKDLEARERDFQSKNISFDNLANENRILKSELRTTGLHLRKLHLDRSDRDAQQEKLSSECQDIGARYLKDNVKWIGQSLTVNNFANCKSRLLAVIEKCRGIGIVVSESEETEYVQELKNGFEKIVRVAAEREEQARIKARIREEQSREREVQSEVDRLDRERSAIQYALEKAMADAKEEHAAEVEQLKQQLAEAEAKSQRAIAQAQLTKAGHIYVVSNIGSFGEGIFKVGMTRRLEPYDRVKELGDASVPFPFDIHMMVSSEDAPALEIAIHRTLHELRVNKVNPRKEFFRTPFEAILKVVQEHEGEIEYTADAEALEYRQSMSMSSEDAEFIEGVYGKFEDEAGDEAT